MITLKNSIKAVTLAFSLSLTQGAMQLASAQQIELDTDEKKYSYAVGTRLAEQLLAQFNTPESDMNMDALAAGIADAVRQGDMLMSAEEAAAAIEARQQAALRKAAEKAGLTLEKGDAFRAENAKKEGVTQTESGLQYTVINSGDSSGSTPEVGATVVVHYRGTLIDGTEFDSSYARGNPASFSLNGIIPGWQEVLQLMRAGDKWSVVIPPELAYGARGAGPQIGPNETLIFEIELIEIK